MSIASKMIIALTMLFIIAFVGIVYTVDAMVDFRYSTQVLVDAQQDALTRAYYIYNEQSDQWERTFEGAFLEAYDEMMRRYRVILFLVGILTIYPVAWITIFGKKNNHEN